MKRVYVAGAISGDGQEYLNNTRKGIRLSVEVLLAGYAPFSPFIDYIYFLLLRDGEEISDELIKTSSMRWLEVSDAVLLVPGWENSKGTKAEVKRAKELGIPVFDSLDELKESLC